ncbi:apolipoprotein N-acyltransferase [Tropicimonas sp. TH_r6]|uniref:apolipoprotein N-acyltransferase n=1 Tax=Tropicimonas sp. TH_r6 TaxID=3082085 RepID=UPI00398751EC
MLASGQAPLGWVLPALVALAAAVGLLVLPEDPRIVAWRGWAFGAGHFAGALFWIVEPFFVDPVRHGWMAPFALLFMAGGLALFWAAAFWLAARVSRDPRLRSAWLVVTLCAVELLRAHVLTGFPWAMIGHIWIDSPQVQLASLVGAHGLTLLTLAAASVPAVLGGGRRSAFGFFVGALLITWAGSYGQQRVPEGVAALADPMVQVRIVQPNAPQHQKWDPDWIPVFYRRQLALTSAAPPPDTPRPDLVIWPETSVPWLLQHAAPAFEEIAEAGQGAQSLAGLQHRAPDGAWFNSLVALDGTGAVTARYDKHHLVPFGEYMPLVSLFARAGIFGLAANETGGYTAGPGPALLDLGAAGKVLPLICYEAIFPNDIARAPGRPDWIAHVTNDAWFGKLSGPWQHLALARLRAIEQGLPVMRAANTGISAVIDPFGRVQASLPLGMAGKIDAALPASLAPTLYARSGEWPALLLLLGLTAVLGVLSRRTHSG